MSLSEVCSLSDLDMVLFSSRSPIDVDDVWAATTNIKLETDHHHIYDDLLADIWSQPIVSTRSRSSSSSTETTNSSGGGGGNGGDSIINHDCMWTGQCAGRHHADKSNAMNYSCSRTMTVNPHTVLPIIDALTVPQTPPMSDDDEDVKPSRDTLRAMRNAYLMKNNCQTSEISQPDVDHEVDDDELNTYLREFIEECIVKKEQVDGIDEEDEHDLLLNGSLIQEIVAIKKELDEDDEDDDEAEEEEEEEEESDEDDGSVARVKAAPPPPPPPPPPAVPIRYRYSLKQLRAQHAAETDHSYHKGKFLQQRPHLGIETPSDSEEDDEEEDDDDDDDEEFDDEEEIDVVSLAHINNRINNNNNNSKRVNQKSTPTPPTLPTYPSNRDKRNLQKTIHNHFPPTKRRRICNTAKAAAAPPPRSVRGRRGDGIKTILPQVRKAPPNPPLPVVVVPTPPPPPPPPVPQRGRPPRQFKPAAVQTPPPVRTTRAVARKRSYDDDESSTSTSPSPPPPSTTASSGSSEPLVKRSLHNNMERQRRIDLRNLFEHLKQLIPDVMVTKQRTPKVMILRGAAQYCHTLQRSNVCLGRRVGELRRHQERLKRRVSYLRRVIAADNRNLD